MFRRFVVECFGALTAEAAKVADPGAGDTRVHESTSEHVKICSRPPPPSRHFVCYTMHFCATFFFQQL